MVIEISQRCLLKNCYVSDLKAALDVGEPRSGTTTKASFVPPPMYTPTPGPLVEEKPLPPRSSTIAGPMSPAIELIQEMLWAALADFLVSTPHLPAHNTAL